MCGIFYYVGAIMVSKRCHLPPNDEKVGELNLDLKLLNL
jgi:hypothetical protein